MIQTPDPAERSPLGTLSPNVLRSKSLKGGPNNDTMGKLLGRGGSKVIKNVAVSPKRISITEKFTIEPRPVEVKAAREHSQSPTKKTHVSPMGSPMRSPKKTPKMKLTNTQSKLLGGGGSLSKAPKMVSSQAKKTRDMILSNEYKVIFPAGAMGLELEPVVISTERKIGCRVRDFYFGMDYEGIEPMVLQKTIRIGDIISSVNGVSVLSASFMDILDILTSNREAPQRVLQFKDVSIVSSWPSAGDVDGSAMTKEENSELTLHALDDIPPEEKSNVDVTPAKASAERDIPGTSPAAWKTYPASPDIFAPLSATTTPKQ